MQNAASVEKYVLNNVLIKKYLNLITIFQLKHDENNGSLGQKGH